MLNPARRRLTLVDVGVAWASVCPTRGHEHHRVVTKRDRIIAGVALVVLGFCAGHLLTNANNANNGTPIVHLTPYRGSCVQVVKA